MLKSSEKYSLGRAPSDHGALVSYTDTRMTLCTRVSARPLRSRAAAARPSFPRSHEVHRSRERGVGDVETVVFFPSRHRTVCTAGTPVHSRMHFRGGCKCTCRRRCEFALSDAVAAAIDFSHGASHLNRDCSS